MTDTIALPEWLTATDIREARCEAAERFADAARRAAAQRADEAEAVITRIAAELVDQWQDDNDHDLGDQHASVVDLVVDDLTHGVPLTQIDITQHATDQEERL